MKRTILIFAATIAANAYAAVPQAVTDGQAAGNQSVSTSAGIVTQTGANTINQMSSATSADTTTVQNLQAQFAVSNAGNSGLATQGNSQLDSCKNYVPNLAKLNATPPDPVEVARKQECLAVNELAGQPLQNAITKSGLTKSDSLFQNPNNMFNLGNTNAGTIAGGSLATVGGGVSGTGSCVTTTETTPATYTYGSCTRTNMPSTQTCQVVAAPTVTSTPFCTIGGSTPVYAVDNPSMYAWSHPWQSWWWAPGPHGTISYRCRATTDPLYALGGIATYYPNPSWVVTGGINFWFSPGGIEVSFTSGSTSTVRSASIINYDGAYLGHIDMYYDGPTDNFYVSYAGTFLTTTSFGFFGSGSTYIPPLVSCAAGYTLAKVQDPPTQTTDMWGNTTWVTPPPYTYCTKPTDASSVGYRQTYKVVYTGTNWSQLGSPYVTCTTDWTTWTTTCSVSPGYALLNGWYSMFSGGYQCYSATGCQVAKLDPCAAGFDMHADPAGSGIGYCYPKPYEISLGTITNDRAKRLYASASGHFTGSAGISKVLNDTVNDSCAALQSQTSNPTATPAVAVNGVFVCPAGKTLSGTNCI